jgi:hypothetical protein
MTMKVQELVRLYAADPRAAQARFDRGERVVATMRHVRIAARMIDGLDLRDGRFADLREAITRPSGRISLDHGLLAGITLDAAHAGETDEPTTSAMTGVELFGLALAAFSLGVALGALAEGIMDDDEAAITVENGDGDVTVNVNNGGGDGDGD